MAGHSTHQKRSRKVGKSWPPKPYPDFPLGPAANGHWQKKIRGKIYYFGRWGRRVDGKMERVLDDGWKAALEEYNRVKDDLYAGRKPRPKDEPEGLTLATLCSDFLVGKLAKVSSGELTAGSFREYKKVTDRLIETFGRQRLVTDLRADDFAELRNILAEQYGPVRLCNEVTRVKTVFKWAFDTGRLDRPVRYGDFTKPSALVLRRHRAENGEKMLEAAEIRKLLKAASAPWKAKILLGINCGLGNSDCAKIERRHLDLARGWLDFPRPKTGIARRCPLWQETVDALKEAIDARPKPKDPADDRLIFLHKYGKPWAADGEVDTVDPEAIKASAPRNSIARGFRSLIDEFKLHRKGIGFYTLRHVFRTVADACGDQVAINSIMGHADSSMAAAYRERIDDKRLQAVVAHVHAWLYGDKE